MTEKKTNQVGTRKEYTARGKTSQKMMSFRLDFENIDYMNTKPNKGRYINDLIAADREKQ